MSCYKGADAVSMEHTVALQTEALSPPHQWVPWVTVDGQYDADQNDQIGDSLLKFVCENYKGANKSKDCPPSGGAPVVHSAMKNVCLRKTETAFLQ